MGNLGGKMERLTEYTNLGSLIQKGNTSTRQMIDKLGAYEEIGTVEEFKALKEKNKPKKIIYRKQSYGTPWLCPECEAAQIKVEFFCEDGSEPKEKHSYCDVCGQKLDWT